MVGADKNGFHLFFLRASRGEKFLSFSNIPSMNQAIHPQPSLNLSVIAEPRAPEPVQQ